VNLFLVTRLVSLFLKKSHQLEVLPYVIIHVHAISHLTLAGTQQASQSAFCTEAEIEFRNKKKIRVDESKRDGY
jgi:hypothetical protein